MAGTPGSGSEYPWPSYPSPSSTGSESQRAQLEATLRVLREQRAQVAAEVGEYLYSLVIQGQLRDPIVLATCRRLYDHEQQVAQLEAALRAMPVAPLPIGPPPSYLPPAANISPGLSPIPTSSGSEEAATRIAPASRASRDVMPFATPDPDVTRVGTGASSNDANAPRAQSGDAATVVHRAPPGSRDLQPPGLPAGADAGETLIVPPRRPEPAPPGAGKPTERRCTHCRMPLRANDTACPVCGRAVTEQVVESPQCRRCGTELRPQDRVCPVCGTPRA
ncbi:MAG: hypothetical protein ACYDAR_07215 [Thermomicrobiales bacterium]